MIGTSSITATCRRPEGRFRQLRRIGTRAGLIRRLELLLRQPGSSHPEADRSRFSPASGTTLLAVTTSFLTDFPWKIVLLVALAVQMTSRQAIAQRPTTTRNLESTAAELILPETQKAIDRGLVYLVNRQHSEGSFGSGTNYRRNVAVTSLAGMALLSAGHMPGRGTYGKNVDKSIDYVLSCARPTGYIIREDSAGHGPMYGHGFATLFLAEVYGMSPRKDIREALKKAVDLIVSSQNREGGWRYSPTDKDADVSVTVCQMMALRAARNCGIAVPKTTVDQCVDYVKKCQNPDGGFRYQLAIRPQSDFPRSAAGVVTLYSAGMTEGREIERGLAYLLRFPPRGDSMRYDAHYFYGQYYAVQAMWHAGDDRWRQWYPAIRDELAARQQPDGSWPDSLINSEYATAMACLVLQMPNNYLPIFQR